MKPLQLLLLLGTFVLTCVILPPMAFGQAVVGPSWATKLVFYNASNTDVACMTVIQSAGGINQQDGCPTNSVNALQAYDLTAGTGPTPLVQFEKPQEGWFTIKRGHQVQIVSTGLSPATHAPTYCISGVMFGFGQVGDSCADYGSTTTDFPNTTPGPKFNQPANPPIRLPNGSTGCEVTLNLPGTNNGKPAAGVTTNESIDITCLAGANCTIIGQLIPPSGGPYWSTNVGVGGGGVLYFKSPVTFQNSWVNVQLPGSGGCDDNCVDPKTGLARMGVFPYGCSQCNEFPDIKPQCGTRSTAPHGNYASQYCGAKNGLPWNNGCGFNRSPLTAGLAGNPGVQKFGGTFLVTYMGPLSPPAGSCK